jgi:putative ABC transport system ATP-binding protein
MINVQKPVQKNKPVIDLLNVARVFELGRSSIGALQGVTLQALSGRMTALVGPSGSGKTTILNIVGALDRPTSGSVSVAGEELQKLHPDKLAEFRNRTVGFVFQNFNLIPVLTTIENVILPGQIGRLAASDLELRERARHLLERVGLAGQMHQPVNRLSGGQMQRVSVARALMNQPRVILADEPTANLDHSTSEKVLELLRSLCVEEDAAVVIATHDPAVLPYCSRIIRMRDGSIVAIEDTPA